LVSTTLLYGFGTASDSAIPGPPFDGLESSDLVRG